MNAELKLENVKKSCKIAKNVMKACMILLSVCSVVALVSAIIVMLNKDFINQNIDVLKANGFDIHVGELQVGGMLQLSTEDISQKLEAGQLAEVCTIMCAVATAGTVILAVIFGLFTSVFKTIEISESPFAEAVIKKLKKTFIAIAVAIAIFVGLGEALLAALLLWCVYTILDYGFVLQTEVDETL